MTHQELIAAFGKTVAVTYATRGWGDDRERGTLIAKVGNADTWGKFQFTPLYENIPAPFFLFPDEVELMVETDEPETKTYIIEFTATVAVAVEASSPEEAIERITGINSEQLLEIDSEPAIMAVHPTDYKVQEGTY